LVSKRILAFHRSNCEAKLKVSLVQSIQIEIMYFVYVFILYFSFFCKVYFLIKHEYGTISFFLVYLCCTYSFFPKLFFDKEIRTHNVDYGSGQANSQNMHIGF
jgi:hypothetical protein